MTHNSELLTVSWFSSSLIEKYYCVYHSDEMSIDYLGYHVSLGLHQVGISLYNNIKNTDVNNQIAFLYILIVFFNDFSNNKDRKAVFSNFACSLQFSLFMKFVEFLIYYSSVF